MNEQTDISRSVYELGYLLIPSIAEDRITAEMELIRKIVADAGSEIIAEEAPRSERLAYVMRKKNSSGSYEKYDKAYFGWIKFDLTHDKIESIKKSVEELSSVLRSLIVTTVRENTYLGKRATAIAAEFGVKKPSAEAVIISERVPVVTPKEQKKDTVAASIEEMDKSIEEMVKGA